MRQARSRLSGPPLVVQLIGLIVGALVLAQLVTLLLTLVLPPAPPRRYALGDIAAALRGGDVDDDRFDRVVQSGPPDLSARGWFVSESSREKLAAALGRPIDQIALGFYTELPVGGAVAPVAAPDSLPSDAERQTSNTTAALDPRDPGIASTPEVAFSDPDSNAPRLMNAALVQQMPGGPPGGGFPGGGPPGGGFPGAGLPGGGFPQSLPQPQLPTAQSPQPLQVPSQPSPGSAGVPSASIPQPSAIPNGALAPGAVPPGSGLGGGVATPPPGLLTPQVQGVPLRVPVEPLRPTLPAPPREAPGVRAVEPDTRQQSATSPVPSAATTNDAPTSIDLSNGTTVETVEPTAGPTSRAPQPLGRPVPIVRPATSLFGFAPSPFVEGDFVAGMRLADGRWAVVSPHPEGFPNAWQRRVALWFLLSLLAVAPVAWLFARRIVGPLNDFAHAADVLGRDPCAAVLPLHGPAEIGRAAHAFNQMQSRLRSFVDDRTAMIGAISHDLRTPLTRLRFRIEDVPEDQQDDLRGEVTEMEAMISSVIGFMRDASIPNSRERRDLAEIVDDVIEDAALLGDVEADRVESAIVDVDPLGVRRVLNNLLTNAMKYGGGHARVALRVENDCAIADIVDDGPGVPDEELERIFEPFYRSEAARISGREGSGLGLAVCRSIARAHGGDVSLFRSDAGFTARVTLPLAYLDDRRAA